MTNYKSLINEGLRFERRGDLAAALELYREAEESDDAMIRSESLRRQAIVHRRKSEWQAALKLAHRASEVAFAADLGEQVAQTLNVEGTIYQASGDLESAQRVFEHVLGITENVRTRGLVLQNLGSIFAQSGDWGRAREYFTESQRCFQRAGDDWAEAVALNNFGRAAFDFGNLALATQLLRDAAAAAERAGDSETASQARLNQAEILLRQGEIGDARALAQRALDFFSREGNARLQAECERALGDIDRAAGNEDTARERYDRALDLAHGVGAEEVVVAIRKRLAK